MSCSGDPLEANVARTSSSLQLRTPVAAATTQSFASNGTFANTIAPTALNLLEKIGEVLALAGTAPAELRAAFHEAAIAAGRRRPRPTSRQAPFEWWIYARVLSLWHRTSEFTDNVGRAKCLPIVGRKGSFQALARTAVPGTSPQRILRALESLGAVKVLNGNRVMAVTRSLIEKHRTEMALVRAVEVMNALISTIHANVVKSRSKKQGHGLFERWVVCERFDMRHLRSLDALVRTHGQSLLELLDEWFARHEIRTAKRLRNAGFVGVEVCIFAKKKGGLGRE